MSTIFCQAEMLIHKPVQYVFDAIVQPQKLEAFWLKHASGPLTRDALVEWEFLVEGARDTIKVNEFVQNHLIAFTFSDGLAVRFEFEQWNNNATKVKVHASGFTGEHIASQAIDTTEGFTLVLCDLKILMETGRSGNLVRDKAVLISAAMMQ